MFALRHLAEDSGKVHDLFNDPAYKKLNHIILSTSTLSDPSVVIGGFGAVVPDGYGIGKHCSDLSSSSFDVIELCAVASNA